jgi:hypothetical protein
VEVAAIPEEPYLVEAVGHSPHLDVTIHAMKTSFCSYNRMCLSWACDFRVVLEPMVSEWGDQCIP